MSAVKQGCWRIMEEPRDRVRVRVRGALQVCEGSAPP